jgi:hypothetical protein
VRVVAAWSCTSLSFDAAVTASLCTTSHSTIIYDAVDLSNGVGPAGRRTSDLALAPGTSFFWSCNELHPASCL